MSISFLRVVGIFDRQDIVFDFAVSPLFIVGPNGTGKSTALKILHFVLSGQWSRLESMPFNGVEIHVNNEHLYLDKSDFGRIGRLRNYVSRALRRPVPPGKPLLPPDWVTAKDIIEGRHPSSRKVPRTIVPRELDKQAEGYELLATVSNTVDTECRGRVLYFPTYRRVERDLSELLEYEEEPMDDGPSIAPAIVDRFQSVGEVVGFGGQDIRQLLVETAARIEVQARKALNEHSVRFLEAIATRKTEETRKARTLIRSGERTNRLLDRLSAFSPSGIDIAAIRESIESLRSKLSKSNPGRLTQQQDMLLFYVSEMITLLDKIDELSSPLLTFSKIIDKYMIPFKRAVLREIDNKIMIIDTNGREIELDELSSGEKQIIAFFAFLFLKRGVPPSYIIVDEPELSLSVSWQRTLIQDLMTVSPSTFLVSATHSPFIFETFSLDNVFSLGDL